LTREQQFQDFVTWWQQYCRGDEKGEAQIFLDRLFRAFGYAGAIEAGGIFEERVHRKRDGKASVAFADYLLPGRVLIEMKKRGENLTDHYQQAADYWYYLVPNRPSYVILCNFDEFWVYDLNRQLDAPLAKLPVSHLPDSWGPLAFLFPIQEKPIFNKEFDLVDLTQQAAGSLAQVFERLTRKDRGIKHEDAQRFILQCMLALFAEDINLLPRYLFTQVIEDCLNNGQSTYDLMTLLFTMMNQPGAKRAGRFHGVEYFNGGIFQKIVPMELHKEELRLLREAANHNWAKIRPAIFGTIFEASMEAGERHQAGAHFTSEADIQRIVQPVIVRPWREQIDAARNADQLRTLHDALCNYRVLDPACGSGNFLYIAYREMKKLEQRLFERVRELEGNGQQMMGLVSANQFYGFDIKPFAVELAKVTLMIAKKLAVDELHSLEHPLPLDNLDSNIRCVDALFEDWPEFDACIGNPPYMGAKRLKQEHSAEYVNKVRAAFPDVPGNADYCVYWFRKAHDLMQEGTRAGLVGTNTIRQNYSREGGLDYIVSHGGRIYEAFTSLPWSGEAKVHISIVCWSKGDAPYKPSNLWVDNGERVVEVPLISASLSYKTDVSGAKVVSVNINPKRVFQGQTPGHKGFVLSPDEAREIISDDLFSKQVIFPYLTGDDLLGESGSQPSRYIVDFEGRDVIQARTFKAAYRRLEKQVLADLKERAKEESRKNKALLKVDPNATVNRDHESALNQWWLHFRGRLDRKEATKNHKRYIACSRVTKRPIFELVDARICPSDALQTFAFGDDYSFGILQSDAHWQWFVEKASTLKSDYRYTPESIFDTFPWPQNPAPKQVKAVADAARALHEYRREAMRKNPSLTLREMYRSLELPGKNPLRDLHTALDKAVLEAYGFAPPRPEGEAAGGEGDLLAQLLALNESVAARIQAGESVTAPGIPSSYPNPSELVSAGCIQPPELL
jgi:SAM-dependent methyltransferase